MSRARRGANEAGRKRGPLRSRSNAALFNRSDWRTTGIRPRRDYIAPMVHSPRLLALAFVFSLLVPMILAASAPPAPAARPGPARPVPGFTEADRDQWVVEQQPGGTVTIADGRLTLADENGCTVWLRKPLTAPVIISYTAIVSGEARVSDLNCFWMASDPDHPDDLFAEGHGRTGAFATYDQLRTYYVGYGGNTNSTTRFRRYTGGGPRPLLPEHDLTTAPFLLKADHPYRIQLIVIGDRVQFLRDGEVIFDYRDAEALHHGWFGFRTVKSRIHLTDFQVHDALPPAP